MPQALQRSLSRFHVANSFPAFACSSGTVQNISRPGQWQSQARTDLQGMKHADISPADSQQSDELPSLAVKKGTIAFHSVATSDAACTIACLRASDLCFALGLLGCA